MKSDHPGVISRYLIHEAQQVHYYGFPEHLALASVTTTPAEVLGMDHRVGYIKRGYDADLVIWDSHPLALSSTPTQAFIDGIPQITNPNIAVKPLALQKVPEVPNFDMEAKLAVEYDGLPPLTPQNTTTKTVVFKNVSGLWSRDENGVQQEFQSARAKGVVAVRDGRIIYSSPTLQLCSEIPSKSDVFEVDLKGGPLTPGLVSFGSSIGLQEIAVEGSTTDGSVYGFFDNDVRGAARMVHAFDGLQFSSRNAL